MNTTAHDWTPLSTSGPFTKARLCALCHVVEVRCDGETTYRHDRTPTGEYARSTTMPPCPPVGAS